MRTTSKTSPPLPEGAEIVGDARKALEGKLDEGRNVLLILDDGVTITAFVKNGKPTDYAFMDKAGKTLPSTLHSSHPAAKRVECVVCTTSNGKRKCVVVPCIDPVTT